MLVSVFVAAFCHEMGHLAAIRWAGGRVTGLSLSPCGITLRREGVTSYGADAFIALAGPFANLFFFLLFRQSAYRLFAGTNLSLALINLCPVATLDGGQTLFALLAPRWGTQRTERFLRRISFVTLFALWFVSVFLLIYPGESLSLFFLSLWLFASLFLHG